MSLKFELLPGEPILLQTLGEDFDYKAEAAAGIEQTMKILDEQKQPTFFIMDMSKVSLSLDDVMAVASLSARQTNVFKHPRLREGIIITQSRMIDLAAKGLSSPIFGNVKLRVFGSVDEALAYARQAGSMRDAV